MAYHDLRRTCAKLCHSNGGELEQIQFLLGHASVLTTERYLGCKQNLGHAVNDLLNLSTDARADENESQTDQTQASLLFDAFEGKIECQHEESELDENGRQRYLIPESGYRHVVVRNRMFPRRGEVGDGHRRTESG